MIDKLHWNQKFSWEQYLRIIENKQNPWTYCWYTAPEQLFKYMYFNKNDSAERISQLEEGKIWFSKKILLNDPNDMIVGTFESKELHSFYELLIKSKEIACFARSPKNKLMWSHYSHGYQGICVCYGTIGELTLAKPAFYISKRPDFTIPYSKLLHKWGHIKKDSPTISDSEELYYGYLTELIFYLKEKIWQYENEYRIVLPCSEDRPGGLHKLEDLNLFISKIYYGFRCDKEVVAKLSKMCERLQIELYEISYNDNLQLVAKKMFDWKIEDYV